MIDLEPRKILIAFLNALGDCVLMSPVLCGLRDIYPNAHLTLMVQQRCAALFRACDVVDEVVPLSIVDKSTWAGAIARAAGPEGFDIAVGPRWDFDYQGARALIRLSKAPIKVGFERSPYPYENPADGRAQDTFTHTVCTPAELHELHKFQALLKYMGCEKSFGPQIWLDEKAKISAKEFTDRNMVSKFAIMAPFAQARKREWPSKFYKEVAKHLYAEHGLTSIVIGGSDLQERLDDGAEDWFRLSDPDMDVLAASALIRRAALFVGADSGPMHIASALETPLVEISCHPLTGGASHSNSPLRFGPLSANSRIVRPRIPLPPCTDGCDGDAAHCIVQISVEEVAACCEELLHFSRPQAR